MSNDTMRQLSERARETKSDGFAILRQGEALGEHSFERTDEPVCIMSVTKMVIAVAFGRLLDDGILASLDTPVADILPEWRQGRKREVTVRMILTHTTALQNDRNAGVEIEPAPDWSQLALCAELEDEPGTAFAYNNKAVLVLHPIIERLTGLPLDVYVRDMLLRPLGIPDHEERMTRTIAPGVTVNIDRGWFRDSTGTPFAAGGLHLRVGDLARIGQVVLGRGTVGGRRIVSEGWIETMTLAGQAIRPDFGLLCRRWVDDVGTARGIWHDGWLGQYLIVLPGLELVIARLIARKPGYDPASDGFGDILEQARDLALSSPPEGG